VTALYGQRQSPAGFFDFEMMDRRSQESNKEPRLCASCKDALITLRQIGITACEDRKKKQLREGLREALGYAPVMGELADKREKKLAAVPSREVLYGMH